MNAARPHPAAHCGWPLRSVALLGVIGIHALAVMALLAGGSPQLVRAQPAPWVVQVAEVADRVAHAAAVPPPPPVPEVRPRRAAPRTQHAAPRPVTPEPTPAPHKPAPATAASAEPAAVQPPAPAGTAGANPTGAGSGSAPPQATAGQPAARTATAASTAPRTISAAQYLRAPVLEYPGVSRRFGEQGRVVLSVLIGSDGVAREVEVEQSSGHARLDAAAIKAARGALYRPVMVDGQAQSARVQVPLNFSLKEQAS